MRLSTHFVLTGLLLAAAATAGRAQIERLDLETMVSRTDNTVHGEIVGKQVFRVDHPVDGPELYFTKLTVKGSSLVDGRGTTVDVVFPGGFIDKERGIGVHNSEAPSEDDTRVGNQVVVFYRWNDNQGGGVAGNALYASHGGLYRTVKGPDGKVVVLGRGKGYAIEANRGLGQLDTAITTIRQQLDAKQLEQTK